MNHNTDKKTILLVDDEVELCELLSETLTDEGYRVLTSNGGHQALDIIKAQSPNIDMVISDIKMPDGDGIHLLESLNKLNLNKNFFFMTGNSDKSANDLRSRGARGVFCKPMDFRKVFSDIELSFEAPCTENVFCSRQLKEKA